jgi:hypothetical protein
MTPTATQPAAIAISSILRVIDTREWIEGPDDRWVAVAGSGILRSCDRCGRAHEVHAYVLLSSGAEAVVGTGCMKGDSLEIGKAMARAERRAKTLARLTFELKGAREALAQWDAQRKAVESMVPPAFENDFVQRVQRDQAPIPMVRLGSACIWHRTVETLTEDDRRYLVSRWHDSKMQELGLRSRPNHLVTELERRLERAQDLA